MKKLMKKTVAAIMAAAFISGGGAASLGGTGLFEPNMTANAATEAVPLDFVSVSLDSSMNLNFYLPNFDENNVCTYEMYDEVIISGTNGRIKYINNAFNYDSSGFYIYYSYPLYANQLDEKVSIRFRKGNQFLKINVGGKTVSQYSYSVNQYCDSLIESYEGKTKNAAISLKNFGLAAENYFDGGSYNIDFLDSEYNLDEFEPESSADVKYSLVLDSQLAARVYIPDLPADAEYEGLQAVAGKNGLNCFEIKNLAPTQLGDYYMLSYGDYDFAFSPLAYCYRAINSTNPKAVDAAKAVYEYYKYMTEYVNN